MQQAKDMQQREHGEPAGPAASGRAPPLYRRAFGILAAQIVDGVLAPGTVLQEQAVADRFGISRAPARQALALLEGQHLVTRQPGQGYLVRTDAAGREVEGLERQLLDRSPLSNLLSWEQIYAEVEGEIVARISFGDWRVREAELARYHGVSRTVARDVVGRLQQRGLVQKDERSHWFAAALTPENVGELYEIRWTLEPLALVKAAPHIPATVLEKVRDRLQHAADNPDAVTGPLLDGLEQDLHVGLLGYCRNRTLMQAIALHQSLLIAHRFLYRWTLELFASEPFLPEHLEVVELLQSADAPAAALALERHLRASADRAIRRVDAVTSHFRPHSLPYLEPLQR